MHIQRMICGDNSSTFFYPRLVSALVAKLPEAQSFVQLKLLKTSFKLRVQILHSISSPLSLGLLGVRSLVVLKGLISQRVKDSFQLRWVVKRQCDLLPLAQMPESGASERDASEVESCQLVL